MAQTTLINDIYGVVGSQGEITDFNVDGKNMGLVRATMGPGGGVEFPGLAPLTAAVRNAVQYIVSHADLEARPPRLWPVDAVPYRLFNARAGVAYGHGTDQRQLVMVDTNTRAATTGYQFPSGWAISDIWPGHGCMLVMAAETATST